MVSPHLELPTLASAVNNLPALMDDQTNLLDQALQGDVDFVVTAGGTIVISKTISLRNFMFNLTGTPSAAFNVDFPTNNRYFAVSNKSGETATIRIDGGGGTTVEVVDAEQRIIYIDGTDVIDVTGVGVPNLETLVTLTGDFTISDTTLTPIDWDAETRDEGSWHDNVTDPEQIKIGAGIVDAVAKIHIIDLDANDTITIKLQRYNSSDALQETLAEDNREHDASVDMVFNLCVLNIRAATGDYLTVEVKSSADTSYKVESDDSYFLVRRSTTGGAVAVVAGSNVLLETINVSGVAEVDITLPSGYMMHIIEGEIRCANDGTDLQLVVTNDGFTSVETGANDYAWVEIRETFGAASTARDFGNDPFIKIATNMGNLSGEYWTGRIMAHKVALAASQSNFDTDHIRVNASGDGNKGYGGGIYKTTETVNGIRLSMSAGNIAIAKLRIWGIPDI